MSEKEEEEVCPLRQPRSLALLAQVSVISQVHQVASKLEAGYIDLWLERELSPENRELEQKLDIRDPECDTGAVVRKFQSAQGELFRQKLKNLKEKLQKEKEKRLQKKAKSAKQPRKRSVPIHLPDPSEADLLLILEPKVISGIPEGVGDAEYIEYRKCKYVEDIKAVRGFLTKTLSPGALNDLMSTMYNIAQYNNKQEHGLLTLQAMLTTDKTTNFAIASPKFYRNFSPTHRDKPTTLGDILRRQQENTNTVDTRIGTTILHFTLLEGSALTHLNLGKACCDSVMKVVAEKAVNLKYLNISGSVVTDQGIFYLCGVEQRTNLLRRHLARKCKTEAYPPQDRLVKNQVPMWERRRHGCRKLTHFEGESLTCLRWPSSSSTKKYYDHSSVPVDCGFVAILAFLPNLGVFLTEVGARAVEAYAKVARRIHNPSVTQKRKRKAQDREEEGSSSPLLPNMRVLGEAHLTKTTMVSVGKHCPGLSGLKMDWYKFYVPHDNCCEEWLDCFSGVAEEEARVSLTKLEDLRTSDIDFVSQRVGLALPTFGPCLSVLRITEVWHFRYSFFKMVKAHCPSLVTFAVTMTTKNVITSFNQLKVDKDLNLQLNGEDGLALSRLEELQLTGPLGCDVARYVLRGADRIKSLYLGVEWVLWLHQPSGPKDLIGVDYLKEVLFVNPMSELEELHMVAQSRRGHKKLDEACLYFVLARFPRLRHLGNFEFWNLSPSEISNLRRSMAVVNRDVTFDEDLFASSSSTKFEYEFVPGRSSLTCSSKMCVRKEGSSILSDIFNVLAGPLDPDMSDDESDSSSDSEDDVIDANDDDANAVIPDEIIGVVPPNIMAAVQAGGPAAQAAFAAGVVDGQVEAAAQAAAQAQPPPPPMAAHQILQELNVSDDEMEEDDMEGDEDADDGVACIVM